MAIENGVLLLEHVKVVQQTRELIGAIRHAAAKNELSEEIAQQTRSEIKAICGTSRHLQQDKVVLLSPRSHLMAPLAWAI